MGFSLWGCSAEPFVPRSAGETCAADGECEDNLCYASECLDPAQDDDKDGLTNAIEANLGTNPLSPDTDGDSLPDSYEVGTDLANPLDEDGDGAIDAVESNLQDDELDCLVNQQDSENEVTATTTAAKYDEACCCGGTCSEQGITVLDGTSCNEETGELTCVTDEPDTDGDGILDSCDWCKLDPNDEADLDGDGVCRSDDNCPDIANADQANADTDLIGDACDPCKFGTDAPVADANNPGTKPEEGADPNDPDGDGVYDCYPFECDPSSDADCVTDNCPGLFNPMQTNSDADSGDTLGDLCDPTPFGEEFEAPADDEDGDDVLDDDDNCPQIPNTDQKNTDAEVGAENGTCEPGIKDEGCLGDGLGDACDPCPELTVNDQDGDGFYDCVVGGLPIDPCPTEPEYYDGDNKPVCEDNCDEVANPSQLDSDDDGIGDACDAEPFVSDDTDKDGILNNVDGCDDSPEGWIATDGPDYDGDGCQDGTEDTDNDNDGVENFEDSCETGELGWTSDGSSDWDGDGCKDDTDEDLDDDNDGVLDSSDECSLGEVDWDEVDGAVDHDADGCEDSDEDNDDDNDGHGDGDDACPTGHVGWEKNDETDHDDDGCKDDVEDADDDDDGVEDDLDACPSGSTGWGASEATDHDGDGCEDSGEDTDDDNDGIEDVDDNCPLNDKVDQDDLDGDGEGDACDADDDGDDVEDDVDTCPTVVNPEQTDTDADGQGDACDDDIDDDGSLNDDDCAPTDPTVHPAAAELCNTIDDNCDSATDEGFEGLGDACDGDDADTCASGVIGCSADGSAAVCQDEAIDCSALNTDCRMGTCEAGSNDESACFGALDHAFCADDEPCTTDLCGVDDGQCTSTLVHINSSDADKTAASEAGCACVDNPEVVTSDDGPADRVCQGLCLLKASCGVSNDDGEPEADVECIAECTQTVMADVSAAATLACIANKQGEYAQQNPDASDACEGNAEIAEVCAPGGCTLPAATECTAYCDALTACYPNGIDTLVEEPYGNHLNYYMSASPELCVWGCTGFKAAGGFDLEANDGELQCQVDLMTGGACPADGLFPCGAPEKVCEETDACHVWHPDEETGDGEDAPTGHYYEGVTVPEGITWDEAKAQAEAMGGHLATLNSFGEATFVATNFSENGSGPWIGARSDDPNDISGDGEEERTWGWVTGESFDLQPLLDALEGVELPKNACLRLKHAGSFSWEAASCDGTASGFLVEFVDSENACNDMDFDEICDAEDNCINTANHLQEDFDADGHGDACDNDADGDEYFTNQQPFDCNDKDPESFPVALFGDADSDGYGDPATEFFGCFSGGTVTEGGDCDDEDNGVFPGAPESCGDGVDSDCDGDHVEADLCGSSCQQLCTSLLAQGCDDNVTPSDPSEGEDNTEAPADGDASDTGEEGATGETGETGPVSDNAEHDQAECESMCADHFEPSEWDGACSEDFDALATCIVQHGNGFECSEEHGHLAAEPCTDLQHTWQTCTTCFDHAEPDTAWGPGLYTAEAIQGDEINQSESVLAMRAICDVADIDRMWLSPSDDQSSYGDVVTLGVNLEHEGTPQPIEIIVSDVNGTPLEGGYFLINEYSDQGGEGVTMFLDADPTDPLYRLEIKPIEGATQPLKLRYSVVMQSCQALCVDSPAACGDDGCGGSCGSCGPGAECTSGECVIPCTPNCADMVCGDDGCGGSCGECQGGNTCIEGACIAPCAPDCDGFNCGDDGCGGICGECEGGIQCVGGNCAYECVPDCFGIVCGSDGCGGTCGDGCEAGTYCKHGWCQEDTCIDPNNPDDLNVGTCFENTCGISHAGDGVCDPEFNCADMAYDGGDCGLPCPEGLIHDCNWNCVAPEVKGDGQCQPYMACPYTQWDGGDCPDNCLPTEIVGCDSTCVPAGWLGDGGCDKAKLGCGAMDWDNGDCDFLAPSVCGDGHCANDEAAYSCPSDCAVVCGDGVCGVNETNVSCNADCGACAEECNAASSGTHCAGGACVSPATCGAGQILDCYLGCIPASYPGDNVCDPSLNCHDFENDEGDCAACDQGQVSRCTGTGHDGDTTDSCIDSSLIGDGTCQSTLGCAEYDWDGGDCEEPCPYDPGVDDGSGGSDEGDGGYKVRDCYQQCVDVNLVGNGICQGHLNCAKHDYDGFDCQGAVCGDGVCSDAGGENYANCEEDCPPICTPNCTNLACGDDGCGGSCGTCKNDQTCTSSGHCLAQGAQECISDYVFTTTNEIQAVSGCAQITGNVTIQSSVSSLAALSNLQRVAGALEISSNPNLSGLNGLDNLEEVVGDLKIFSNPTLVSLEALNQLTNITGMLDISSNANLEILGLAALAHVHGGLTIVSNQALCQDDIDAWYGSASLQVQGDVIYNTGNTGPCSNPCVGELDENGVLAIVIEGTQGPQALDALSNCQTIQGDLRILGSNFGDLNALNDLKTITGALTINDNLNLITVSLPVLESVGGDVHVANNTQLSTLGLAALNLTSQVSFDIFNNYLCNADVVAWVQGLGPNATVGNISNNNGACICEGGCDAGHLCNQDGQCVVDCNVSHVVEGDPSAYLSALQGCTELHGDLTIQSTNLTQIGNELMGIGEIHGNLVIRNNPYLTQIGIQYLNILGGDLVIHSNGLLDTFAVEIEMVVAGAVNITHNAKLCQHTLESTIDGVNILTSWNLTPGNDGCVTCTPECQQGTCGGDNGCGAPCECTQGETCEQGVCQAPPSIACSPSSTEPIDCNTYACPEDTTSLTCVGEEYITTGDDNTFIVIEREGHNHCPAQNNLGEYAGSWSNDWYGCYTRRSGISSAACQGAASVTEPDLTNDIIGVAEWSSQCRWLCSSNNCTFSVPLSGGYPVYTMCGDGILFPGMEECDDGNNAGGDGCDPFCVSEPAPCEPSCISGACGLPDGCGELCGCDDGEVCGQDNFCANINECAAQENPPCSPEATCVDTDGSHGCTCNVGFIGSGVTCECTPNCAPGHCGDDGCGGVCACGEGQNCNVATNQCESIPSCTSNLDCGPGQFCNAASGECSPNEGEDQTPCQNDNQCGDHEACVHQELGGGSYCQCAFGYQGNPGNCTDIDECADPNLHACSIDETCMNSIPEIDQAGYYCEPNCGTEPDPGECEGVCDTVDSCGNICGCPEGEVCNNGTCELDMGGDGTCIGDFDCQAGEVCMGGICEPDMGGG